MNSKAARNVMVEISKVVLAGMCVYGASDYSVPEECLIPMKSLSGGRFLYLTNLSLYLTILTISLSYLVKKGGIKRLDCFYKDMLALSFSLEGIVTSMFWVLILIDPTLVKDKELYEKGVRTGLIAEMSQHLAPFLLLSIDQLDVKLRRRNQCIYFLAAFSTFYFLNIWFHSTRNGNKWAYPIFNSMTMIYRILFVAMAACIGVFFYLCLLGLNNLIHGKELER